MKNTLLLLLFAVCVANGCGGAQHSKGTPGKTVANINVTNQVEGSGVKASESRDVGEFTGVQVKTSGEVQIQVGETQSVSIETDDNLLELITTEVADGTLVIASEQPFNTEVGLHVAITVPVLKALAINGSANVEVKDVAGESFETEIQGSGDATVASTAEQIKIRLQGSGDATITGAAKNVEVDIKGSGNAKLFELAADTAHVAIAGSGDADVQATQNLNVTIAGSGGVRYHGDPKVTESIVGSGKVERE